ncbi:hypothetical protein KFU94_19745 [Chloroflexi bacterium TSY]|nr:hypothetical protein [Chloroflexi bacterium TSY]
MEPTKLIIIEGIMGSGKSTTAEFLDVQLRVKDIETRLLLESNETHPIQMRDPAFSETVDDWMAERVDKWQAFVNVAMDSECVTILDGQLFHENVDSLLYFDVAESTIEAFVTHIYDIIDCLNPTLIYFYQDDIRASIRKTFDRRGSGWETWQIDWKVHDRPYGQKRGLEGFDGFVQIYSAHRNLTDRLFQSFLKRKLAIENSSADWPYFQKEILDFIGIEPEQDHSRKISTQLEK